MSPTIPHSVSVLYEAGLALGFTGILLADQQPQAP